MKQRKYWVLIAVSLCIMIVAGLVSAIVKTDGGNTLIRETKINTRGGTLSGMLYLPKSAISCDAAGNYTDKRPGIILSHGYLNSNQMQDPNAIELSRRGFVVLSIDMYAHGNSDAINGSDDPTGSGGTFGAIDAYNYMLSLPYVDHTRIGLCGHSMGGMNVGNAVAIESGFYTLSDTLLNMLHDELGVSVTAQDVAAQDPDTVASKLDASQQGVYSLRKAEIEKEYADKPFALVFMGSGPGFAGLSKAKEVEVAGISVWRDLQANVGVTIGLYEENSWLMFSTQPDGINDAARIPESNVARVLFGTGTDTVGRGTWYKLDLAQDSQQLTSTVIGSLDQVDAKDATLKEAFAQRSARVMIQPPEFHMGNHFSLKSTEFVVQFFTEVMGYNNGEIGSAATPLDAGNAIWPVKEFANGFALAAMLMLVYPLAMLLMETPFFANLKGKPAEPKLGKKNASTWITLVLLVVIQGASFITLFNLGGAPTTWAGAKGIISWGTLTSQEMTNRIALWAVANALIALALILIKRFAVDRKYGVSLREDFGLSISWENLGKTFLLSLLIFFSVYMTVVLTNFFFAHSDMRMWVIAARQMTLEQVYTWLGYLVFFGVFYIINSLIVNSARMKDMSEGKNLAVCAVVNGLGITIFEVFNIVYLFTNGHCIWYEHGNDFFLAMAVILPQMVVLPLAAIYARKLYNKTGSIWLGGFVNAMLFTWMIVGNTAYHFSLILK